MEHCFVVLYDHIFHPTKIMKICLRGLKKSCHFDFAFATELAQTQPFSVKTYSVTKIPKWIDQTIYGNPWARIPCHMQSVYYIYARTDIIKFISITNKS